MVEDKMSELIDIIKDLSRFDLEHYYIDHLELTEQTDTYIRERVKDILTDFEINGDSYGVPAIEDIVDLLCEKIENHKEELEELKAWKEEATEVMNKLQLQEIGKELQLPLGSDIPSQILPEIKRIKAHSDYLISINLRK